MNNIEITYIIKNLTFNIQFEPNYFKKSDEKKILDFITQISKSISIDKSYVDCQQNKHNNTFLYEDGWNALKTTLIESDFGLNLARHNHEPIITAIVTMAKCYLYDITERYYANQYEKICEHIEIIPNINDDFTVIICKDTIKEWKNYPGDWTQWK